MSINQKMATYLAFAFIVSFGLFNMVFAMNNLWKKRRTKRGFLVFRLILGFFIFCTSLVFGYFFIWIKRGI